MLENLWQYGIAILLVAILIATQKLYNKPGKRCVVIGIVVESDRESQKRLAYERLQRKLDESNRNAKESRDEEGTQSDRPGASANNACRLEPRSDNSPSRIAPRRPYANGGGFCPNIHTTSPQQQRG